MVVDGKPVLKVIAWAIGVFAIAACEGGARLGPPGTTGGIITINSAQVVSRECPGLC
jgi:hypothetical protein